MSRWFGQRPTSVLLAPAGIVVLVLGWSGGSLADPDVWWHVRTGRWILEHHAVPHTDPWAFTSAPGSWVPTAWLSDALFGAVWHLGGYSGIRVLRVVLAAVVVVALWLVARRFAANHVVAFGGISLVVLALWPFLRERPQVLSYLFVAWLAVLAQEILAGRPPPLLTTVGLTYLWANLHGMWVLAPVVLLGAGILAWLEDRSRVSLAARCSLVGILGCASALITPAGPRLAIWPFVVQRVAVPISEWQPTELLSGLALPFMVILALLVVRWSRTEHPVPFVHIAYVLGVGVFGLTALRNVAPAAILLLPELVRNDPTREAEHLRVSRIGLVALASGVALGMLHLGTSETTASWEPTRIAHALTQRQGANLRILNAYNVGGFITGTASPPAHVAIDGRTDIWSARYVRDYLAAFSGGGNWRSIVDQLRPNAAIVVTDSDVARGLVLERGWEVTLTDGSWSLLEPP